MPIVSAPRVVAGGRLLAPGAVAVEDARIVEVLDRRPPPGPELVERLLEAGSGILELVTLAPERDGAIEATKRLAGAGVVVSVGHSDALAEQAAAAAEAGARMVTHVFNAQRGLHHREPGVAGPARGGAPPARRGAPAP